MSYKYYSPLRPLSLGTFPKPQGNEILHIENFKERQNVPEIARQAWGYIEYKEALTEIEAAAYRHAGEFRPPAHYRGQSRGLRRVSGSVQTVCRP